MEVGVDDVISMEENIVFLPNIITFAAVKVIEYYIKNNCIDKVWIVENSHRG